METKHFVLLLCFLFILPIAFADGAIMVPPTYVGELLVPEQRAVIYWDGSQEQLILSTKVSLQDAENYAWVVPIQSDLKPEIEQADEQLFFDLVELFEPVSNWGKGYGVVGAGGADNAALGVEVIETKKIDIYDIAVLKATDSSALLDWLNQNGFSFPKEKENVLEYYVTLGNNYKPYYFVANKVNLQNKYPGLVVSEADRLCIESLSLERIFSDPYAFPPYVWNNPGEYAKSKMDGKEECENASVETVSVLADLSIGISTPLKYSFTPEEPTYPMHMTSINSGNTEARVFLIGQTCFSDKEGYLDFEANIQNPGFAQEKGFPLGNCITKAGFDGNTKRLIHDSFFEEKAFFLPADPNYVSPEEKASELIGFLFVISAFVFVFSWFVLPFLVLFFGLGILARFLEERFKQPVLFKVLAVILVIAISYFCVSSWLSPYFFAWNLFLGLTVFSALSCLAGYFSFKKKSWKLGIIYFVLLLVVPAIVGGIMLLSIPPVY